MKNIIRLALAGFVIFAVVPTVANAVDGDPWTTIDQSAPHRPAVPADDVRGQATTTENVFTDLNLTAPLRKDLADGANGTLTGE